MHFARTDITIITANCNPYFRSSLSLEVCNELMFVVKNGYPNALSYSWQQGSDEQVLEQKEKFLTATNNLHATADNVNKLKRGFEVRSC